MRPKKKENNMIQFCRNSKFRRIRDAVQKKNIFRRISHPIPTLPTLLPHPSMLVPRYGDVGDSSDSVAPNDSMTAVTSVWAARIESVGARFAD